MVHAFAFALGLQLAAEWGVIAFTLNFIPFVGPFIATMLPTLYALAQFESLYSALFVFACLNLIQFAIGSYVEPRVAGNALALSPFLVLFSVFLWMFLWGLFGAFIGVPITIAVLTFCAQTSCISGRADAHRSALVRLSDRRQRSSTWQARRPDQRRAWRRDKLDAHGSERNKSTRPGADGGHSHGGSGRLTPSDRKHAAQMAQFGQRHRLN